ncbi:hypothetical protein QF004_002686 [Chryseobacterium sp. MDT2-18]|nr:hypothetical protein [Chryseobacterium sp. MDT2-18]
MDIRSQQLLANPEVKDTEAATIMDFILAINTITKVRYD